MSVPAGLLIAFLAAGPTPPSIETARTQVKRLQFAAALKSLKALERQPGLTRAQVIELYELEGITHGSLGDRAASEAAFVHLLALEPARQLGSRYSPKVTTPFFQARSKVKEAGALALTLTPKIEAGRVRSVEVRRTGLFREQLVRVTAFVREDDAPPRQVLLTWRDDVAVLEVDARQVDVGLRGVSAQDWELYAPEAPQRLEAPVVELAPAPPLVTAPPAAIVAAPAPAVESAPRYRPAAWTLLGVGVASLAVGTGFLVSAANLKSTYDTAATDERGVVVGLTRAEAQALEQTASLHTTLGIALLAAGGAAAIAFGIVWGVGTPRAARVTIAPTQGGAVFALSGAL
jgi:hypothetical protein